ncbi:hypothetical protein GGI42DRAFT_232790 [Trichoderma sp. SZMC 28013]
MIYPARANQTASISWLQLFAPSRRPISFTLFPVRFCYWPAYKSQRVTFTPEGQNRQEKEHSKLTASCTYHQTCSISPCTYHMLFSCVYILARFFFYLFVFTRIGCWITAKPGNVEGSTWFFCRHVFLFFLSTLGIWYTFRKSRGLQMRGDVGSRSSAESKWERPFKPRRCEETKERKIPRWEEREGKRYEEKEEKRLNKRNP